MKATTAKCGTEQVAAGSMQQKNRLCQAHCCPRFTGFHYIFACGWSASLLLSPIS